jgi:hypothetical protein
MGVLLNRTAFFSEGVGLQNSAMTSGLTVFLRADENFLKS